MSLDRNTYRAFHALGHIQQELRDGQAPRTPDLEKPFQTIPPPGILLGGHAGSPARGRHASSLARSGVPGGGRGLPSGMGGAAGTLTFAPCPSCRTVAHLPASVRALSSPSAGGREEAPPASKSSHRRPCNQFSAYMRILPFTLAANSSCSAAAALAARMMTGTNSGALRVAASHISAASAFPRR